MKDFKENFADQRNPLAFSDVRSGLIVGMLSIGTLVGALVAAPLTNTRFLGRKYSVCLWCIIFRVGMIVQISALYPHWCRIVIGRVIAGLSIGALSILVPMYQGESSPNPYSECDRVLLSAFHNHRNPKWHQLRMGFHSWIWYPLVSRDPRFDYRQGKVDKAAESTGRFYGIGTNHTVIAKQMQEMEEKFQAEQAGGDHPWYEMFTGPRMPCRVLLGMGTSSRNISGSVPKRSNCVVQRSKLALQLPARLLHALHH